MPTHGLTLANWTASDPSSTANMASSASSSLPNETDCDAALGARTVELDDAATGFFLGAVLVAARAAAGAAADCCSHGMLPPAPISIGFIIGMPPMPMPSIGFIIICCIPPPYGTSCCIDTPADGNAGALATRIGRSRCTGLLESDGKRLERFRPAQGRACRQSDEVVKMSRIFTVQSRVQHAMCRSVPGMAAMSVLKRF